MTLWQAAVLTFGRYLYPVLGIGLGLVTRAVLGVPAMALLILVAVVGSRAAARHEYRGLGHLLAAYGVTVMVAVWASGVSLGKSPIDRGDPTWWFVIGAVSGAVGCAIALVPPPRLSDEELDEALGGAIVGPIPADQEVGEEYFELEYNVLKDEFDRIIAALDSISGRVVILPGLIVGLGALSLGSIRLDGQLYLVSLSAILAAVIAAAVAITLSVLGMRTRRFSFGPNPMRVYEYAGQNVAKRRMALRFMALITQRGLDTTIRQAWFLNLALIAAMVSLLSVLVLRLIGGAEGG